MAPHRDRLRRLIALAGGEVEGRFVTRPGVELLAVTQLTPAGEVLLGEMHIDQGRPPYEQLAEFNARITYMSFRDAPGESADYNRKMIDTYGHLSVHAPWTATVLVAGVSLECCLELVAHSEARVARLTSSRTAAMADPLYRLTGEGAEREIQAEAIEALHALHAELVGPGEGGLDGMERRNRLLSGARATALTVTMSIKDWHKTLIGRLSHHGVEAEVCELIEQICGLLHGRFPLVIKTAEHYYGVGNAAKYEGS